MLKSKTLPKMVKIIIACTFLAVMVSGLFVASAAGNYSDTLFEFQTPANTYLVRAGTPYRDKLDKTSCYAYNMKSNTNVSKVLVYGSNSTIITSGVDCTYSTPKALPKGAAYYFPSLVKERGYKYAALDFYPTTQFQAYLYIWWSPDSI